MGMALRELAHTSRVNQQEVCKVSTPPPIPQRAEDGALGSHSGTSKNGPKPAQPFYAKLPLKVGRFVPNPKGMEQTPRKDTRPLFSSLHLKQDHGAG